MWPSANEHPILRLKAVLQDSDRHTGSGRNMLVIGAGRKEKIKYPLRRQQKTRWPVKQVWASL